MSHANETMSQRPYGEAEKWMFLFGASIGGIGITAFLTTSQLISGMPYIQFGFFRARSYARQMALPGT